MDNQKPQPFEYKDWNKGIADSPTDGFANMRNVNIEKYPGNVIPGFPTVSTTPATFGPIAVTNYTPGAPTYIQFGSNAFTPYTGQAVIVSASSGGLTAGNIYYLSSIALVGGVWTAQLFTTLNAALAGGTGVTLTGPLTANISSVNMGTIMDFKTYYPPFYSGNPINFAEDDKNQVWVQDNLTNSGTISMVKNKWYYLPFTTSSTPGTNPNTQGLAIYFSRHSSQVWLFASYNNKLSVMRIDDLVLNSNVDSWDPSVGPPFHSFNTANYHRMFVSQTGVMYVTDGPNLYGFTEISGSTFVPATAGTYAWGSSPLLPSYEIGTSLENLNDNLMIGGLNSNLIYPYNEIVQTISSTSTSQDFVTTQTPIRVGERGIYQLKNINNTLYILAGTKGIVYYTSGSVVTPLKKIPEYLTGGTVQWGGIEKIDGNLLFGFLGAPGNLTSANNIPVGGVGKLFLTEQIQLGSVISSGTLVIDQSTVLNPLTTNPTALLTYYLPQPVTSSVTSTLETYILGSVSGIDAVDVTNYRTDGSAFVDCPIENAASLKSARSFQSVGVELLQPLTFSDTVNIQYRSALNGTFAEINQNTPTFSATQFNGSATNAFDNSNISSIYKVQLRITLSASTGTISPVLNKLLLS